MKKELIIAEVLKKLEEKIKELDNSLLDLQADLNKESKSSAGDKHETGRAMLQIELEQVIEKLKLSTEQLNTFKKIDFSSKTIVTVGALIQLENQNLLVCEALGKIKLKDSEVYCLSNHAPIFEQNKNKKIGDELVFNGKKQKIIQIL